MPKDLLQELQNKSIVKFNNIKAVTSKNFFKYSININLDLN